MPMQLQGAPAPVSTVASQQEVSQGSSELIVGLHHIYLLPSPNQNSLKMGRTDVPYVRIPQLKKTYPGIDLAQSVLIAVDTNQIETILKTVFKNRGRCVEHRLDGFTEWFDADIKEDVIDLCLRISEHRRFQYAVQRGLENTIGRHCGLPLPPGKRRYYTSRSERTLKEATVAGQLSRLAAQQAHCFTLRLQGQCFRVVRDGSEYLIARPVFRSDEPECWQSDSPYWASTWSQEIRKYSLIRIHLDHGECFFRLIATSFFEAENDDVGREYLLVSLPPEAGRPSDDWTLSPGRLAARCFWRAFADMPVEERLHCNRKLTTGEAGA